MFSLLLKDLISDFIFAIDPEAILYTVSKSVKGRQFVRNCFFFFFFFIVVVFFSFCIYVMIPCLRVIEIFPTL